MESLAVGIDAPSLEDADEGEAFQDAQLRA